MVLSPVLDPFVQHNPFAVSARIALDHALSSAFLNDLFEQHAKVQYCRTLTFATLVELMSAVVFRQARSVREAYQRSLKDAGVSLTALYSKVAGVELQTMRALVHQTAARLRPVLAALAPATPWVEGFCVKILDGNSLAGSEHRLAPLRDTNAATLPGMSLVIYEPEWRLITDVFPSEDAYTQERTLLPAVLETVQPGDLWLGDRSFAIHSFFRGLHQRGATFLLREHGHNTVYDVLGAVGKRSKGETGFITEQRIWLHLGEGQGMVARRITVELFEPTQDGDTHLHLITSVPRPKLTARRAAELYRNRWHIEHAFLDLTRDLRCEVNTLAYPKAALFGFCTALVGFNVLAVCKQAVEAEHGREQAESLSSYALVGDIRSAMRALEVLVSEEQSEAWEQASAKQLAKLLRRVVKGAELLRYRKAERGPKKKKPRRKGSIRSHVSTARQLSGGSRAP